MYPDVTGLAVGVSTYLALYALAALVAAVLLRSELRRHGYPPRYEVILLAAVLVSGALGAKLYHVIENWSQVALAPANAASLRGSGWFGGFLFGGLAALITLRLTRQPVLKTLDIAAPILPLAQAIGRLGCFFGGCCHGVPSDVPWALGFRGGLYAPSVRVHPTQLYEMVVYLAVFGFLWKKRDTLAPGQPLALYLFLAGGGRFVSEIYRLNPKVLYQLTAPQLFVLATMVVAVALLLRRPETTSIAEAKQA